MTGHVTEKDAPVLTERCPYITAANMRCLLATDEDHSTGHDILGDLHDDPEWGRQRAWAWVQVERSRLVGLLYVRCACGHTRGAHTRGPAEPGGPCCFGGCACRTYVLPPAETDRRDEGLASTG